MKKHWLNFKSRGTLSPQVYWSTLMSGPFGLNSTRMSLSPAVLGQATCRVEGQGLKLLVPMDPEGVHRLKAMVRADALPLVLLSGFHLQAGRLPMAWEKTCRAKARTQHLLPRDMQSNTTTNVARMLVTSAAFVRDLQVRLASWSQPSHATACLHARLTPGLHIKQHNNFQTMHLMPASCSRPTHRSAHL